MMNKKISVIVFLVLVISVVLSMRFWMPLKSNRPNLVEEIRVANHIEYGTLIWIAEHQGYFTDNGLKVNLKDYPSGVLACNALIAGQTDIALSAGYVFVSNVFNNPDLRILATEDTVENEELVARKDRGIQNPSDLKGKKIGVTSKSSAVFFLGTFLLFNHLSLSDVKIVDVSPQEMADFLLQGKVDAVVTWPPFLFNTKKKLGSNSISWSVQRGQRYNMLLLAKEKFIQTHKGVLERFLRSLIQAEEFVSRNNQEAKKFIQEKYNYETSYMDDMWLHHHFEISLSQALLLLMEDQTRWRIKYELTPNQKMPNYLNYIYLDALDAVHPQAVTIIR